MLHMKRDRASDRLQLYERDLTTGADRLVHERSCVVAEYSPDGRSIAMLTQDELVIVPRTGGEPRRLCGTTDGVAIQADTGLVWSPDGAWILVGVGDERRLVSVDVRTGNRRDVGLTGVKNASLRPDGRQLAFTGEVVGQPARTWTMRGFLPVEERPR